MNANARVSARFAAVAACLLVVAPNAANAQESTTAGISTGGSSIHAGSGSHDQHERRHTRFGSTVFEREGETYRDAFLRVQRTYGRLGAVRMFSPGLPPSWSKIRQDVGDTRVIVSFKAEPAAILSGRHDRTLRQWFAAAPEDRITRWSYWHEPEDDIEAGQLRDGSYRRAWKHLHKLANSAHNSKLRSTLILMCWTAEKNSGRRWRDYYAGDRVVDLLAFDCYNAGHRNGRYRAPRDLLGPASRLADRIGKPWAVTELGSVVVSGDRGRGRAGWLRRTSRFLRSHDARFCTYFDSDIGVDFRLHDGPSRKAWRGLVRSQWK